LKGKVVLPGIIDAHTHLIMFGASYTKLDMLGKSNAQIQATLREVRTPETEYLLGKQFIFSALGSPPNRATLDEAIPDIPVFLDSADLHSCWLNTKAIEILGVTRDTPNPDGGEFEKDAQGELTGLFKETAVTELVWPYLSNSLTVEDRLALLDLAFEGYLATGVTGVVDMAMQEEDLVALEEYHKRRPGGLPISVAAHWIVHNSGSAETNAKTVQVAARHRDRLASLGIPLNVVGIKIISDGVVDSCTAYLTKPYANGSQCGPIWPLDQLKPIVALADSLNLQTAVHAIGDAASVAALDAFEHALAENEDRPLPRFRIEHLEVVSEESIKRLTQLGVVASLQPLHADPVYVPNWREQLGQDERCDRAFPWTEYKHSHVAFGSDAPTAPHYPFPNLYTATTRRSCIDTTLPDPVDPRIVSLDRFCLELETAIRYYTVGSAYSFRAADTRGTLEAGKTADFCVLSIDPFAQGVETLRRAQEGVLETWVNGKQVWKKSA
jgi:predicted amidohydrolase YtcJ